MANNFRVGYTFCARCSCLGNVDFFRNICRWYRDDTLPVQ